MTAVESIDVVLEALAKWPSPPVIHQDTPPLVEVHRRLLDALDAIQNSPSQVNAADLAGLIAHILRREDARHTDEVEPFVLHVPASAPWPAAQQWERFGVSAVALGERSRVQAISDLWPPEWLEGSRRLDHVFAEHRRRTPQLVAADPAFEALLDFKYYRGVGQRQAVRSLFAVPRTSTVVVALPTGTGKSSVAYAAALSWSLRGGVSIVMVPTIALALDQERALRGHLARLRGSAPPHLAYHSGLGREDRRALRERIRDGTQGIVFAGPESLTGSLVPALYDAADRGYIRLFAIDEAHLVSAWGAEFRPEFQALAGLRADLLGRASARERPFPTLLMTATLTEEALRTVAELFGRPGPFVSVCSLVLRPEAAHWLVACSTEARQERLFAAIDHLPRPMIIYTTEIDDAVQLADALKRRGYARVGCVTGNTKPAARGAVIHGFGGSATGDLAERTRFDIVVATSAFGLGVDNPGVRTVLHACVPESIDRYYQEVGRAGRDGNASAAVMLYSPQDLTVAEGLAATKVITSELGLKRWIAMEATDRDRTTARRRVSLKARHAGVYRDSDANRSWNLRTLSLLARARLIDLVFEPPPPLPSGDVDDPAWQCKREQQLDEYFNQRVVLIREDIEAALQTHTFGQVRERTRTADRRGIDLMRTALAHHEDLADVLTFAYSVGPDLGGLWHQFAPEPSCGGCPWCWDHGRQPYEGLSPVPPPLRTCADDMSPTLKRLLEGSRERILTVLYQRDTRSLRRNLAQAVAKCVLHGITTVLAPNWIWDQQAARRAWEQSERGFVFAETPTANWLMLPAVPTMVVLGPEYAGDTAPGEYYEGGRAVPARVLVMPSDLLDPERPEYRLEELHAPVRTLEQLLAEL